MYWIKTVYLPHYDMADWGPLSHSQGNLCADLRAAIAAPLTIDPGQTVRVPLGVIFNLSPGEGLVLWPRSSLSAKGLLLSTGIIDPDYRGEVQAVLHNFNPGPVFILPGERICQTYAIPRDGIVFQTIEQDALRNTARGAAGFGSSGRI